MSGNLFKDLLMFKSLITLALTFSFSAFAQGELPRDGRIDIWPSIPFIKGADLCNYADAYGQTRTEYMGSMVGNAERLLQSGATGSEALKLLVAFNSLYDRNQAIATQHQYLDVTLESTFKAFFDQYYRDLRPKIKRVSFTHVADIQSIVHAARNGQRAGVLTNAMLAKLDFIAYGTYAYAPSCRGDILVTLHLVGRDGRTDNYEAQGKPATVMSQIASKIFEQYQRTNFPNTARIGNRQVQLIGALNGTVDQASSPELAAVACETLGGRLPNQLELELLDAYGDWNGGVSLGDKVWAMPGGKVYHPGLRNPSPVREVWEVNDKSFYYYCVK